MDILPRKSILAGPIIAAGALSAWMAQPTLGPRESWCPRMPGSDSVPTLKAGRNRAECEADAARNKRFA